MKTIDSTPVLLALLLSACGAGKGDPAANPDAATQKPLVRVAQAEVRRVRQSVEASSYLEAEHRVTVLSEVAGKLAAVLVDEGQRVERGAVILRLDDREARSRVAQAQVQVAAAEVKEDLAQLDHDASAHRVSQARIERDRQRDIFERNKTMGEGLIAPREIDESRYAADAAVEALQVAEFDARKAEIEVLAARNAIDDAKAKLADALLALAKHEIQSPLAGVVESLAVKGGETIGTATELCVLTDPDRLVSYLHRPQRELALLRDAREVRFTTDAWPDREFMAAIDLISPVVDATSGSFRIRMRIAAADAPDLRPGLFVRARVMTEAERDALMVPKAAVLTDGAQPSVFVIDADGLARRVIVDPGLEEHDALEVRNHGDGGLLPGDRIVVAGHRELRDRAAVEVAP